MNWKNLKWCIVPIFCLTLFCSCANVNSVDDIRQEHAELESRIHSENVQSILSEKWVLDEYAEVYRKISNGKRGQKNEYAQLLREITRNTIEFEDEDVFEMARNCNKLFEDLANNKIELGIQDIDVKFGNDGFVFKLEYADLDQHKYGVKLLSSDMPDFVPDGSVDYDGSLGEYRMLVSVSDIDLCNELRQKYSINQIYTLGEYSSAQLKLKIVRPDTSSVYIYIGSDKPLSVTEVGTGSFPMLMGTFELKIDVL